MKKSTIFFIVLMSSAFFSVIDAGNGPACGSEESCINDDSCQCYCSVKCGFRKKELAKGDRPVYKKGVCWCKEWDYQNYLKRHCDLKEKAAGQAPTLPAAQNSPAALPMQNLLDY